jgi:hypothetical protein
MYCQRRRCNIAGSVNLVARQSNDDDGKCWSPRANLSLAGAVSLHIWGALALIAACAS